MYIIEGISTIFQDKQEALRIAKNSIKSRKIDLNKVISDNLCKPSFLVGSRIINDEIREKIDRVNLEKIIDAINFNEKIDNTIEIEAEKIIKKVKPK
jgi:hypothetical protein